MRCIALLFILLWFIPNCYANSIAIEFQENESFTGVIGTAQILDNRIELVTFVLDFNDNIVPFAWIERVIEKKEISTGVWKIKCQNQLGVVSSGTIDISQPDKSKIKITSSNGISITNISEEGIKMKNKYIPKVNIGN